MAERVFVNLREFHGQPPRALALHADYACENSGRCCEEGWGIRLLAAEREKLSAALAAGGMAREEIDRRLIADEQGELGAARFACGARGCVFHEADGAGQSVCAVQRAHGHGLLPTICQSFPRVAVRTPAGIYLTLSYACPTAARLLLGEGGLCETAPRRALALAPHLGGSVFGDDAEAPRFSPACQPSWQAFDYFWRWAPEWVGQAGLTPGEALYGLGLIVGHLEGQGRGVGQAAELIVQLDQIGESFPAQLKKACAAIAPVTLLGVIHFETLLNMSAAVSPLPAELREIQAQGGAGREPLARDYDLKIRPRLAEFERIERNYIGSRLYANQLVFLSATLRAGYFAVTLGAVAFRMSALALCRARGRELDEGILLEAAGMADKLLLHNALMGRKLVEMLEARTATAITNLAQPAIF